MNDMLKNKKALLFFLLFLLSLIHPLMALHPSAVLIPSALLILWAFYQFRPGQDQKNGEELKPVQAALLPQQDLQTLIEPLNRFFKEILKHNEIDLTRKIKPSHEALQSLSDSLNFLLSSLGEILSFFMENSERLSIFSSEIDFYTRVSKKKSEDQISYALEIIELIQKLLGSFKVIVMESQEAFQVTDSASSAYEQGRRAMKESLDSIKELGEFMGGTTRYLQDLQAFSKEVEGVMKLILEMSNKTNVLSLNASIEAVRAGEAGRGFKVVAQEIQRFSQKTTEAGRKVSSSLSRLNEKMEKSFQVVEQSRLALNEVTRKQGELESHFETLSKAIERSLNSTRQISDVAGAELSEIESIDYKINHLQEAISDFKDDFILLSKTAGYIIHTSEDLSSVLNHFRMEGFQTLARQALEEASVQISGEFDRLIQSRALSVEDCFDASYEAKKPEFVWRLSTRYDQLIEPGIQKILEGLKETLTLGAMEYGKMFLLCFLTDQNGYCPVHLKEFSRLPSGRLDQDEEFSLAKRRFDDPVSKKAAKNTRGPLLQVYMKEAGIRNIDLSVPVRVQGKPWGCLRARYNFF